MTKFQEELKKRLDRLPWLSQDEGSEFFEAKSLETLLDDIEAVGYSLEAHQRGIAGTLLVIRKKP